MRSEDSPVSEEVESGTLRVVDGRERIYYDGYWICYYTPPEDTLAARKRLIDSLTRRLFHHTEGGINTPGERLDLARESFENETDPARKRINAAMLAGALFNRATDIFTTVVELAERGVQISTDNELMRLCEECFQEALDLGTRVRHYSGEEGIDELWGEPLKAFVLPISEFYESRYLKISQTLRDIDDVAERMVTVFGKEAGFEGLQPLVLEFAAAARRETETMRSDEAIFRIWPRFVAAGEALVNFRPLVPAKGATEAERRRAREGVRLVRGGRDLITYLAGARVPMPKSAANYLMRLNAFADDTGFVD